MGLYEIWQWGVFLMGTLLLGTIINVVYAKKTVHDIRNQISSLEREERIYRESIMSWKLFAISMLAAMPLVYLLMWVSLKFLE